MQTNRFLLIALSLVASTCFAAPPRAGEMAPDLAGVDANDQPVSPADYRGKVVVVSFWASRCGPCLKELPILEGIQQTAGKKQIQVIAVNMESRDIFRRLARKLTDFQIMVTNDAGRTSSKAYDVDGIPHMIIIDRTGRIVRINRGYDESGLDRIIADINRALVATTDAAEATSP
jgi:thiol-disulfide isomerase/thioredoxin